MNHARVLDLGARSCADEDGWVVGRLVPSGQDGVRLFDTPPLPVSERTAVEVAAERGRQPWKPITAALEEGRLVAGTFMREDLELLTDVQELRLLAYGTPEQELARVTGQLRQGRDEIGRAAFRVLRGALVGSVPEHDVAFVAAAALNPFAHREALKKLCPAGAGQAWCGWSRISPERAVADSKPWRTRRTRGSRCSAGRPRAPARDAGAHGGYPPGARIDVRRPAARFGD